MKFELPPLPYRTDALEPYMSQETVELHYEKHHRGYLNKLQKLLSTRPEARQSLEQIMRSSDGEIYNNAAQVWNHTFFWNCMEAKGGGQPGGEIAQRLRDTFGGFENFADQFIHYGEKHFGSGYVWLITDHDKLQCVDTADAGNPLLQGHTPLLTCDLWEHAYYLDHRNERGQYLSSFLDHLVNWDFVNQQLIKVRKAA